MRLTFEGIYDVWRRDVSFVRASIRFTTDARTQVLLLQSLDRLVTQLSAASSFYIVMQSVVTIE